MYSNNLISSIRSCLSRILVILVSQKGLKTFLLILDSAKDVITHIL